VGKFWGFLRDFFKSPLKRRFGTAVPIYFDKIKKHGVAVLFVRIISWGVCPKPGHKGLFEKSPLESQKLRQNKVVCSVGNSFAYFSYKKSKRRRFGTAVPTVYDKIKKHGNAVLFRVHYQLGLSAPNPDTRNFSGKVSWNFKSFAKMK